MLKKGQIKFTKKAAVIAKKIASKKKASEFLIVVKKDNSKPLNSKDLYKKLLEVKQDPGAIKKVYTTNINKAETFFNTYLLKDGRLSLILSPIYACALYITKDQEQQYNKIKKPDHFWPAVYLDEDNSKAVNIFETKIKRKSIDLSDIILD